jgi:hypothetical protein
MRFRALLTTALSVALVLLGSGIAEASLKGKPIW